MKNPSPREHAFSILHQVETAGAYSDKLLQSLHHRTTLSARECAFINQVVKGVLEKRHALDTRLNELITKGIPSLPTRIQTILRLGAYQLLELQNVSQSRTVSESVTLAKKVGHEGTARLVNAVLRRIAERTTDGTEALGDPMESFPTWIRERVTAQWGIERCRSILTAFDTPLPLAMRVNTLRSTVLEVQQILADEGWQTRNSVLYPGSLIVTLREGDKKLHELKAFEQGLIFIQDEASSAVVPVLEPKRGELIIDLCAAPGGKTTLLAELTGDAATILAIDPSPRKLFALRINCERLGISSVTPIAADGCALSLPHLADRILVDVPCSGLGAIGKKKDLRWNRGEEQLQELFSLQVALLQHAITLVKPGGIVVYSTCSIDKDENERVIKAALELGGVSLSSIPEHAAVGEIGMDGASLRLWPDQHGSTGAFACRLRRSS